MTQTRFPVSMLRGGCSLQGPRGCLLKLKNPAFDPPVAVPLGSTHCQAQQEVTSAQKRVGLQAPPLHWVALTAQLALQTAQSRHAVLTKSPP